MNPRAVLRDRVPSLLNSSILITIILALVFGWAKVWAQTAETSNTVIRDPASLALLAGALEKLGGAGVWQAVRASHVTGSISTLSGKSTSVDWLDDWSQGPIRYRRTSSNGSTTKTAWHDGNPIYRTRQGSQTVAIREFDKAGILLAHLPGAALAEILSNKTYSVASSKLPAQTGSTEIDVTAMEAGKQRPETEERWLISTQTGLPESVLLRIPDVLNSTHVIWQAAMFLHYKEQNGLVIPDQVEIVPPNRQLFTYKMISFEPNPPVAAGDFSAGAPQ